jgi:hypothetical protein
MKFELVLTILLLLMILLNLLIYKLIIIYSVRKFIKPFLKEKGLEFIDYNFVGFFSKGNFGKQKLAFRFIPINGNIFGVTYVYIYAKKNNKTIKFTAKITSIFLYVKKVEYSEFV